MPGHALEWSHGKPRSTVRVDEVPALPTAPAEPFQDATTGRFLKGNRAARRRQLKVRAEGIATLDPSRAPSWMIPHIAHGKPYIGALLTTLEGRPALHPLAGDCADAHVMYRALLALALATDDAKERASLLSEARGWLREHRTTLATIASLAGDIQPPTPDATPWLEAGDK